MALSASEKTKIAAVVQSFLAGSERFTNEEVDVASKATFGDLVVEFLMDANKARRFENIMTVSKRKNERLGFNVNKITESKARRIIKEEAKAMGIDLGKLSGDRIASFETGYEFGQEDSGQGYHPEKKGGGLSFEDSDPLEEAGMIKSNLSSIAKKAQSLHDMVGDADDLPEWVQEKIAVADEMIDVIKDYLEYEYNRSK